MPRLAILALLTVLLQAEEFSIDMASAAGWVLPPGGSDEVTLTLRGPAWQGTLRLELCDAAGRLLRADEQPLAIAAGATAGVRHALSLRDRPAGEHLLRCRLVTGPKDDRRQVAGWERSLMAAGPEHAFILLEREPVARGLELVRKNVQPVEIVSGGLKRWVWKATFGSAAQGWWRSHRFQVTDPAFREGRAPVVDAESWSVQRSDAPINLAADTRQGGIVAGSWGGRGPGYEQDPPWRHILARLDEAVFAGGRAPSKPEDNWASGCDLRYNACTADGELRSLVLTRYDLVQRPHWPRLLRLLGVEAGAERYVFAPGTRIDVRVRLGNRARVAYRAAAQVSLHDAHERELWRRELAVDIAPESDGALTVPVETAGLPCGVYSLRTRIGEHLRSETLLAVSGLEALPKAAPGEFLYGTDLGGRHDQPGRLAWADFMGIDIVRNLARGEGEDLDDVDRAVAALRAHGLQGTVMVQPAWDPDPGKRAERNRRLAAFIGEVARRHAGFLRWYELGNEPDLPFFYAGPIDAYVEGYRVLHAAIKAADPDSVVMNGGLCFHGQDGFRRAHELVAKLPGELVDAWAYHGHGPGIGAERAAWRRQEEAVRAVGKAGRDCIETESGLSAQDWPSRRRQAQTIVQKAVFAQSVKAPLFLWFNLHMGGDSGSEWGYTTIERGREPRPAVLAHRTMVRALRGLAWQRSLDLAAPQAEAHLFAAADGRRALVAWCDQGELLRSLAVGPGARDLRRLDLSGNAEPLVEATPGLVQLACDADPVFITWTAGDPGFAVAIPPPPLLLPERLRVVPGRPAVLPVTVRHAGTAPLVGELAVAAVGTAPVAAPARTPVAVPVGGRQEVALPVQVAAVAPSLWPRQWTVFAPVDGPVDLARLDAVPAVLTVKGRELTPAVGLPRDLDLDLARLAGGFAEHRQALCFAWLDSDREQEVEFGAGADWWMEWWVNGRQVFSTIEHGNQGPYTVLAHVWKAKLRQGRNLLAVRVLSGSGGWRLVAGGPDEVAAARRARSGQLDALRLDLTAGGKLVARQDVAVEVLRPVERIAGRPDWASLAPDGDAGAVENLFIAVPDAAKHHQGRDDFSAQVWLREDGERLLVAVRVRDDVHRPGDGAELRLATGAALGAPQAVALASRRDEAARTTWYEGAIPRARLGQDRFAVQVRIADDDWGELKQRTAWGEGDEPERWFQAWLR